MTVEQLLLQRTAFCFMVTYYFSPIFIKKYNLEIIEFLSGSFSDKKLMEVNSVDNYMQITGYQGYSGAEFLPSWR